MTFDDMKAMLKDVAEILKEKGDAGADAVWVWLDLADGSRIPGPQVADSDEELTDFLAFLASRSEVSARPFSSAQPRLHLRVGRCAAARRGSG